MIKNLDSQIANDLYRHLTCPICRTPLRYQGSFCTCENRHSFDFAKEGYLHLLPANQMHKKIPGDNAAMVSARHTFLKGGYYQKLKNTICDAILTKNSQQNNRFLDIGCGEGYYTEAVANALFAQDPSLQICAFDISKYAVKCAAKRFQANAILASFSVASAYHLPYQDDVFSTALNVFSPLCIEEIFRCLKDGGSFYYAVPAPRHLWQLKEVLYEVPYENRDETKEYDGFSFVDKIKINDTFTLPNQETIQSLFSMTPYAWRSPKDGVARLQKLESLTLDFSFYLYIYRKE
jgi:23S rRNA (guanine745-N1)-methyltransferase